MQHSPGPWQFGPLDRNEQRLVVAEDGLVAVCAHECLMSRVEIMEANAHLIAAAPDLLAACKAMRATMYSPKSEESVMADAAIAKAEGR